MEKKQQKMMPTPSPINMGYKVLIGTPHADVKNYCLSEFLARVKNLSYKNYDILFADNSNSRKNYKRLIKEDKVDCIYIKPKQKPIQLILAETLEAIRDYFLRGKYDYLLHLESDIIPPNDVIERLMIHNLPIVSATYFIEEGYRSHLMIQSMENFGDIREVANIKDGADLNMVDGKLHEVFAHGLGCCLIRRDVLEQIPFRWSGGDIFPDTYFAYDCDDYGFKKFIDTSILCKHLNESWTITLLNNQEKIK